MKINESKYSLLVTHPSFAMVMRVSKKDRDLNASAPFSFHVICSPMLQHKKTKLPELM